MLATTFLMESKFKAKIHRLLVSYQHFKSDVRWHNYKPKTAANYSFVADRCFILMQKCLLVD